MDKLKQVTITEISRKRNKTAILPSELKTWVRVRDS